MSKSLFLVVVGLLYIAMCFGQDHNAFKYQAILRDNDGKVIANEEIALRMSILTGSDNGSIIYSEEHTQITNAYGLVSLNIGLGGNVSGEFNAIDWGTNTYFLQIELNKNNEGYTTMGTSPLLAVPYALHAQTASNVDDADADPTNELQTISIVDNVIYLSDGGSITLPTENQFSGSYNDLSDKPVLSGDVTGNIENNEVSKLKGRVLSENAPGNGQVLKWNESSQAWIPSDDALGAAGTTDGVVSSAGFTGTTQKKLTLNRSNDLGTLEASFTDEVNDADADPTNELQILSISNDSIHLSNGGSVKLPYSFSGSYADLADKPVLEGDVKGELSQTTVDKIQGKSVSPNIPGNGQVLKWNENSQTWIPSDDALGEAGTTDGVVESIGVEGETTKTISLVRSNGMATLYATFTDQVNDADADASNELQNLELVGTDLTISNGNAVDLSVIQDGYEANTDNQDLTLNGTSLSLTGDETPVDLSVLQDGFEANTDNQELSIESNLISITGGENTIDLSGYIDNTDNQTLNLAGTSIAISGGNAIDLSVLPDSVIDDDADPTNELQTLSFENDSIKLSDGNGLLLPNGLNLWETDGENVLLPQGKVGLGTTKPTGKLEVKGNPVDTPDDLLFGVMNNNGDTVFAVYQGGVRIYVDDSPSKTIGSRGGFAVGGFTTGKGALTNEYLRVTPDSVRVYVDDRVTKAVGSRGGFAVGGFTTGKTVPGNEFLRVTPDSVRVYIDDTPTKATGSRGGFAVGGFTTGKGNSKSLFDISAKTSADVITNESRILFYPNKDALLAGTITIESAEQVGANSANIGYQNIAQGQYSQAFGFQSMALGNYSMAVGKNAYAAEINSFAFGEDAKANKAESYSFGRGAIANGYRSFAFGSAGVDSAGIATGVAEAKGDYSFSMGQGSVTGYELAQCPPKPPKFFDTQEAYWQLYYAGHGAVAIGVGDSAVANYSTAIGYYNTANYGSVALGFENKVYGMKAVVAGGYQNVTNNYATVIGGGLRNTINESYSSILGGIDNTIHEGASWSVILGSASNNIYGFAGAILSGGASAIHGESSTIIGGGNISYGYRETIIGSYNNYDVTQNAGEWVNSDNLFVVANGTNNTSRSNAMIIYKNGNAQFNEKVGIGTATSVPAAHFYVKQSIANEEAITIENDNTADTWSFEISNPWLYLSHNGSNVGVFKPDGSYTDLVAKNASKTNVKKTNSILNDVLKLEVLSYNIENKYNDKRYIGLKANHVKKIFPHLVSDENDKDSKDDFSFSINYSGLSTIAIKAIQEQQTIIDKQAQKIEDIEKELEEIKRLLLKINK